EHGGISRRGLVDAEAIVGLLRLPGGRPREAAAQRIRVEPLGAHGRQGLVSGRDRHIARIEARQLHPHVVALLAPVACIDRLHALDRKVRQGAVICALSWGNAQRFEPGSGTARAAPLAAGRSALTLGCSWGAHRALLACLPGPSPGCLSWVPLLGASPGCLSRPFARASSGARGAAGAGRLAGQLFLDARGLARAVAQVVQLGTAHVAAALHLDVRDQRRIELERPLDTLARRDLADYERRVQAAVATRDHDALVGLQALAGALDDVDADDHRVARGELGNALAEPGNFFLLELLDQIHDGCS